MLHCLLLFFKQPVMTIFSKTPDIPPSSGFNHLLYHWLMVDVLLGVKFCSSHILHFLCCFLYISFCISFLLYCSSLFFWLPFLKNFFTCVHVSLNSFSSVFLLISYLLLPILLFYLLLHWKYYFILNWVTHFPSSLEAVIQHPTGNLFLNKLLSVI